MIKYIDSITFFGLALLLLSTLLVERPDYNPIIVENQIKFNGEVIKIHQSNKTSLITITTSCELPIRIFHQIPYNFTLNETISGYGEISKEKEIIAQKLIAQTLTIR